MGWKEKTLKAIQNFPQVDSLSQTVQEFVRKAYRSAGIPGSLLADFLHGTWLGHPLHSVLTDAAIGSYTSVVVLDSLEVMTGKKAFGEGADVALQVGVASGLGAAAAGITDWQHANPSPRKIGLVHALLNASSLALYAASLGARSRRNRSLGWGLAYTGFGLSMAAAWLGGELAYREKMGVNHAPLGGFPERYTPVMELDSLAEGKLTRVEVNDLPVLLLRRGQAIYAIAETCSHMGGPLSEGSLEEGDIVVCPWHGSRYALEDGSLKGGPSVYSQPCLETRVVKGSVQVRRPPQALGQ